MQTPILLSNTFAVGTLFNAMVRRSCLRYPQIGRGSATINPLVLECNDGYLNDIQAMAVREEHVFSALDNHSTRFARGSVGAGRGMSSFGLKGGIGTASRYCPGLGTMLGVLVLANFGTLDSLTLSGVRVGPALGKLLADPPPQVDAGSVIIIIACDRALDSRQLNRIARRAGAGLGRVGSHWGMAPAISRWRFPPGCWEPRYRTKGWSRFCGGGGRHRIRGAGCVAERRRRQRLPAACACSAGPAARSAGGGKLNNGSVM